MLKSHWKWPQEELKGLAEDLECPICMGELYIPNVLQCKHVFCDRYL